MGITIGQFYVRRAVQISASPDVVWYQFREINRMRAWFGVGHQLDRYEPKRGGQIELSVQRDGAPAGFGGEILVFDETRELTFENNWFGRYAWSQPTLMTIKLSGLYDGTHVELFHHGFERFGKNGADQFLDYESGWDVHHLALLKGIVEG